MNAPSPATEDVKEHIAPARVGISRWVLPIVTFVCGCLVGAGVTFKTLEDEKWGIMKRPGPDPDRIIAELKKELGLTPQQLESVSQVVREHDARMQELHREMHPRFDKNSRLFEEQISKILDNRQQELWRDRVERMRKKFPPPDNDKREPKS